MPTIRRLVPAVTLPLLLAACAGGDRSADTAATAAGDTAAAGAPALVGVIEGMRTPESVRWDPNLDVYYVANIEGVPTEADGNGFIARVHPDSLDAPDLDFIRGGRNGVTLNAPKGMAIVGDTLWVADITAVRGFDRRTGAPVATIDLAGQRAVFLNDIAAGTDGALYVTDTGLRVGADGNLSHAGPDRIFRIAGRTVTVAAEGASLAGPNGITWDAGRGRFIVVPFAGDTAILGWSPGSAPAAIGSGPGQYDGVELLPDGRLLVSSWADSSVHVLPAEGGSVTRLVGGVEGPADIGVDTKRNRVLVPSFTANRVAIYGLQ